MYELLLEKPSADVRALKSAAADALITATSSVHLETPFERKIHTICKFIYIYICRYSE